MISECNQVLKAMGVEALSPWRKNAEPGAPTARKESEGKGLSPALPSLDELRNEVLGPELLFSAMGI